MAPHDAGAGWRIPSSMPPPVLIQREGGGNQSGYGLCAGSRLCAKAGRRMTAKPPGSRRPKTRRTELHRALQQAARRLAKEAADLFAELEAERESLHAQLGAVPPTSIDAEALRAMAEQRVLELRRALDLSPDRGRSLFLSLLGGCPIGVLGMSGHNAAPSRILRRRR
jgi:hypothetical protein